eukprot:618250-Amphidinium_carterae.1
MEEKKQKWETPVVEEKSFTLRAFILPILGGQGGRDSCLCFSAQLHDTRMLPCKEFRIEGPKGQALAPLANACPHVLSYLKGPQ